MPNAAAFCAILFALTACADADPADCGDAGVYVCESRPGGTEACTLVCPVEEDPQP